MRFKYKAVPVALAAAFILSAAMASTALATEWYTESPQWAQAGVPLSKELNTVWNKGTLKLTDTAYGPLRRTVTVECEDAGEGVATKESKEYEHKWTASNCVTTAGTSECESPTMEAVHLGVWNTTLTYSKGTLYGTITNGGNGTPGFKMTCTAPSGKKTDECTGTLKTALEDVTAGVKAPFRESTGLTCSSNNGTTGTVEGSRVIEAGGGGKLEAGVLNKLTSSLTVKAKGELTVRDTKSLLGELSVKCTFETEGPIEASGKGKITLFKPSNCKPGGVCSSLKSVTSVHLPWGTELSAVSESDLRDTIVSGGSGTPGWDFECETGVGPREDICNLNTSLRAVNAAEGNVELSFDPESKRTSCSLGGNEAGKWEGTLTITHPATVNGIRVK